MREGNTATEDTCSNSRESPALTRWDQSPQQRQADLWELFTAHINTESTLEADKKTVMSQLQTIPHKIPQEGANLWETSARIPLFAFRTAKHSKADALLNKTEIIQLGHYKISLGKEFSEFILNGI